MDDGWDIFNYDVAGAGNFSKSCNTLVKVISFIIAPGVVIKVRVALTWRAG